MYFGKIKIENVEIFAHVTGLYVQGISKQSVKSNSALVRIYIQIFLSIRGRAVARSKKVCMFANWTIDGAQHCFNKNWYGRQKCGFLRNTQDLLYSKKTECISSPEQNYFSHFAMRYPVDVKAKIQQTKIAVTKIYLYALYLLTKFCQRRFYVLKRHIFVKSMH